MTPSHRGRLSRAKGIRFERKIARALRAAGFDARRILEYDGYSHGCDIALRRPGEQDLLPIAIQCKATKDPLDGARGLKQAMDGWKRGKAYAYLCFYSYTPKGRRRAITKVIAHSDFWDLPSTPGVLSLPGALSFLRRIFLDTPV